MSVFLTSDLHFGHKNILHLGNGRPFNSIEEHDNALIENWNTVVKPGDRVYVLGDFTLRGSRNLTEDCLKKLNGNKHLILGNHDETQVAIKLLNKHIWQSVRVYDKIKLQIDSETYSFVLCHYPILEFDGAYRKNVIHAYGHIHDTVDYTEIYDKFGFKAVHVGVDTSDKYPNTKRYSPINVENIISYLKAR